MASLTPVHQVGMIPRLQGLSGQSVSTWNLQGHSNACQFSPHPQERSIMVQNVQETKSHTSSTTKASPDSSPRGQTKKIRLPHFWRGPFVQFSGRLDRNPGCSTYYCCSCFIFHFHIPRMLGTNCLISVENEPSTLVSLTCALRTKGEDESRPNHTLSKITTSRSWSVDEWKRMVERAHGRNMTSEWSYLHYQFTSPPLTTRTLKLIKVVVHCSPSKGHQNQDPTLLCSYVHQDPNALMNINRQIII